MSTVFQLHQIRWKDCDQCQLSTRRKKVVLARGKIPCEVLFIGEAPGQSEDVLGAPFVGPAGKLLDDIITEAKEAGGVDKRTGFTNLIACIPKDEDNKKVGEPEKDCILSCKPRLEEFVAIAQPVTVVMVGLLSQKWVPKLFGDGHFTEWVSIIHPAAILRMDISQSGLAVQRTVVTLTDVYSPPF